MENFNQQEFIDRFEEQNLNGLSLYINAFETTTLHQLENEWLLYRKLMKQTPIVRTLILSSALLRNLPADSFERLIKFISRNSILHPSKSYIVENNNEIDSEHKAALTSTGFLRSGVNGQPATALIKLGTDKNHVLCLR